MGTDDGRLAATLKTTLSCSIIASAFAAIAVEAAIAVFVIDKRQDLRAFITLAIIAACMLILSAMLGALGIARVYKPGYAGTWKVDAGKGFFSTQALTGGIGLLLVVISAFCGNSKPEIPKEPADYQSLKSTVIQLQKDVSVLQASTQRSANCVDQQKKNLGKQNKR